MRFRAERTEHRHRMYKSAVLVRRLWLWRRKENVRYQHFAIYPCVKSSSEISGNGLMSGTDNVLHGQCRRVITVETPHCSTFSFPQRLDI